jgi:hypothetical protein
MQAEVRVSDGLIMGFGRVLGHTNDSRELYTMSVLDSEVSKLYEPGNKYMNMKDGTITVVPPDPNILPGIPFVPSEQAVQTDQIIADGLAALETAPIKSEEGIALRSIFANTLQGLGSILGTESERERHRPQLGQEPPSKGQKP